MGFKTLILGRIGTYVVSCDDDFPAFSKYYSDLLANEQASLVESTFLRLFTELTSEVSENVDEHLPEILFKAALQVSTQLPGFAAVYAGPALSMIGPVAYDIIQAVMACVSDVDNPVSECEFISGLTSMAIEEPGSSMALDFVVNNTQPVELMNQLWASEMNLTPVETEVVQSMAQNTTPQVILPVMTTKEQVLRRFGLFVLAFGYRYVTGDHSLLLINRS